MVSFVYAWLYFSGIIVNRTANTDMIVVIGYMWLPAVVAIFLVKRKGRKIKDLGIVFRSNRWFLFAWIVFLVLNFANIPVNLLFPGTGFSWQMTDFLRQMQDLLPPEQYAGLAEQVAQQSFIPLLLMVAQGMIAGLTVNALAGFGEELGWRGYLYRALDGYGFWTRSLMTGFVWGIWHAPIIYQGHNYPGYPVAGIFLMTAWCILLAPLFSLIREKSGSVVAASIAHGTLNGTIGISIVYITGGHQLVNAFLGISGFITLLIVNVLIFYAVIRKKPHRMPEHDVV